MNVVTHLQQQHRGILSLVEELRGFLVEDVLQSRALDAVRTLMRLSGGLRIHLSAEDLQLYPRLVAEGPTSRAGMVAQRFSREMGGLRGTFDAYVAQWRDPQAIARAPAEFIARTQEVLEALEGRIAREERELYPLLADEPRVA